jgi:hypothetical protein
MTKADILCLANSRKSGGRCVAGIRIDDGSWIRPVSDTENGELTPSQCTLDNQLQVRPLDIVRVYLKNPAPRPHQPENWKVTARQWRLRGRMTAREARRLLKQASETHDSGIFGSASDRISMSDVAVRPGGLESSLTLLKVAAPEFRRGREHRQKRAVFDHCGTAYDLAMTFEDSPDVGQSRSNWYLTVSLGEPFHGDCYKLIAAAIEIPPK